jgi:hypothetical protein
LPYRAFLGWDHPALESAADWLLNQAQPRALRTANSTQTDSFKSRGKPVALIDLANLLVVIPAARARRRLLQLLSIRAAARNASLLPPEIVTVGNLPEHLYDSAQPLADSATRLLTWLTAFQSLTLEERRLFLPRLAAEDLTRELSFAQQLVELHRRLGTEVRSFRSVHEHLENNPDAGDRTRWEVLAKVQASYYERLSRQGFWDLQAARNVAIRKQLCRSDRRIVVIGAVDLTESHRQMLLQLGGLVTALIFAPPDFASAFDPVGGLQSAGWLNYRLNLPESAVRIVDRPTDQAEEVLAALRDTAGEFTADQITIGMPDDQMVPPVELALENNGIAFRRLEGKRFAASPAVRLAECLANYLERPDFSIFAQLIRHPDLFAWLSNSLGRADWLPQVDTFQAEFLASRFPLWEVLEIPDENDKLNALPGIQAALRRLLEPARSGERLALSEVARRWRWILEEIYDTTADDSRSRETSTLTRQDLGALPSEFHTTCEQGAADTTASLLIEAFATLERSVPGEHQLAATTANEAFAHVTIAEALTLALAIAPLNEPGDPPNPKSIELVGWLDLPWDDAPVLIVTALNEEAISSQEPVLPLLPPPLIESLGIGHPQQRHARNLYALNLMVRSRQHVRLICGRRDSEGNPNLISRLLLAEPDELMVERVNAYFNYTGDSRRRKWLRPRGGWAEKQSLLIPRPEFVPPVTQLSVTRFRDYIKCPYRFYLNSILHLEPVCDSLREMDGGAFGNLAHDVLEKFGRDKVRLSDDPAEIFTFLNATLNRESERFRQQSWFAAVEVQVESLRERFRAFAEAQAEHRANGWEIIAVEQSAQYLWEEPVSAPQRRIQTADSSRQPGKVSDTSTQPPSAGPFLIRGRIDRIDRHRDGRLAVWDYKTSDAGTKAGRAHRDSQGNWIDLQLPLYRYLIENVSAVGAENARQQRNELQLGYILLPRATKDVGFDSAKWTPAELESADELARQIIERLRSQEFWPPQLEPPDYSEQYAAICQDNVFERSDLDG